jgi:hypothetical protein
VIWGQDQCRRVATDWHDGANQRFGIVIKRRELLARLVTAQAFITRGPDRASIQKIF